MRKELRELLVGAAMALVSVLLIKGVILWLSR